MEKFFFLFGDELQNQLTKMNFGLVFPPEQVQFIMTSCLNNISRPPDKQAIVAFTAALECIANFILQSALHEEFKLVEHKVKRNKPLDGMYQVTPHDVKIASLHDANLNKNFKRDIIIPFTSSTTGIQKALRPPRKGAKK